MSNALLKTVPKINGFSLRRPRLLPLFSFVALLVFVSLFFVWSRLQVVNLEYDISRLESHLRQARLEKTRLRLEVASLRSPGRLERMARNELGLRLPAPEQIVNVE